MEEKNRATEAAEVRGATWMRDAVAYVVEQAAKKYDGWGDSLRAAAVRDVVASVATAEGVCAAARDVKPWYEQTGIPVHATDEELAAIEGRIG